MPNSVRRGRGASGNGGFSGNDGPASAAGSSDGSPEESSDAAPSPATEAPQSTESESKRGKRGGEMGAPPSFLDKLCDILNHTSLSQLISWNKEGDGIAIGHVEHFASKVLPKYYKHNNYQSFVRQLNIYGFHKTKHDEQHVEFKHPNFRRGQRHLLRLIRRKSQGSASPKQRRDDHGTTEAKDIFDRVTAEMRRVCNRVSALEAQIWVMNDRHHTLKLESTALWRTVLEAGDGRLRTKAQEAMAAVQRVAWTSAELEVFANHGDAGEETAHRPRPSSSQTPLPTQQASSSSSVLMTSLNNSLNTPSGSSCSEGVRVPSQTAVSAVAGRGSGDRVRGVQSGDDSVASTSAPHASTSSGAAADQLISDTLLRLAAARVPTVTQTQTPAISGAIDATASSSAGGDTNRAVNTPRQDGLRQEKSASASSVGHSKFLDSAVAPQQPPGSAAAAIAAAAAASLTGAGAGDASGRSTRGEVRGWNSAYYRIAPSADARDAAIVASKILPTDNDPGDSQRNSSPVSFHDEHEGRGEIEFDETDIGDAVDRSGEQRWETDLMDGELAADFQPTTATPTAAVDCGGDASGDPGVVVASGEHNADRGAAGKKKRDAGKRPLELELGPQEIKSARADSNQRRRPAS